MELVRTSIVFRESTKYPLPAFEPTDTRRLTCTDLIFRVLRENRYLTSRQIFDKVITLKTISEDSFAMTLSKMVNQKKLVKEKFLCECCSGKGFKYRLGRGQL